MHLHNTHYDVNASTYVNNVIGFVSGNDSLMLLGFRFALTVTTLINKCMFHLCFETKRTSSVSSYCC